MDAPEVTAPAGTRLAAGWRAEGRVRFAGEVRGWSERSVGWQRRSSRRISRRILRFSLPKLAAQSGHLVLSICMTEPAPKAAASMKA
jgi:hypothetical protein